MTNASYPAPQIQGLRPQRGTPPAKPCGLRLNVAETCHISFVLMPAQISPRNLQDYMKKEKWAQLAKCYAHRDVLCFL
jgi:hypothetical protein